MGIHEDDSNLHQGWAKYLLFKLISKLITSYNLLQPKGQIPDYGAPVVLHDYAPTIENFCDRLHKGIMMQFRYAWVWGSSVRHQPQKVSDKIFGFRLSTNKNYLESLDVFSAEKIMFFKTKTLSKL